MSTDSKLAEALRRISDCKFGMTTADAYHLQEIAREALAAHEAAQEQAVEDEQSAFEAWCPYKGNPDPRTVWAAAFQAGRASAQAVPAGYAPPMPEPYRSTAQHISHPILRKVLFEPGSYYTADQLTARDQQWLAIVKEAVEREREECAKDCERAQRNGFSNCATTIRSRSTT